MHKKIAVLAIALALAGCSTSQFSEGLIRDACELSVLIEGARSDKEEEHTVAPYALRWALRGLTRLEIEQLVTEGYQRHKSTNGKCY